MQFFYRGIPRPDNEVEMRGGSNRVLRNPGGAATEQVISWTIGGKVLANSQLELTAFLLDLQALFSVEGGEALWLDNAGNRTVHTLGGNGSEGGCRIVEGVTYQQNVPGEYSKYRSWQATLEATYAVAATRIAGFTETVTCIGTGGPRYNCEDCVNGPPDWQLVNEQTSCIAYQQGTIIGRFGIINPPDPIWPVPILQPDVEITPHQPRRTGPAGYPIFRDYEISYRYSFKAPFRLFAFPTAWPE